MHGEQEAMLPWMRERAPAPFDELSPTGSIYARTIYGLGSHAPGVVSTYAVDSVWQCQRPAVVPVLERLARLAVLARLAGLVLLAGLAGLARLSFH